MDSLRAICLVGLLIATASARAAPPPEIPIAPDVTFVIAVSNATPPEQARSPDHIAQGDYETVVTITAMNEAGISQKAFIDGVDASGTPLHVTVTRTVTPADLAGSHLQVLGFMSTDPAVLKGTTALGPSLAVVQDLIATGRTTYSFQNFSGQATISGMLSRAEVANVKFPVLINGQRVELNAIRASGQMSPGGTTRPFEHFILAHPRYPISLRIAYGPRNGTFPFKPDFSREIVRIDFPLKSTPALSEAFAKNCRVEVPGIYFDFNEATLKAQSARALREIAAVLSTQPHRHVSIEGHTDNIGSEKYNDDLSAARAAAVKAALVNDFKIDASTISTQGFGLHRPLDSNDTLAGRARNRRVELVRDCGGERSTK